MTSLIPLKNKIYDETRSYHQKNIKLAKSFILKSLATAFIMNGEVEQYQTMYRLDPLFSRQDETTWRYYCHLAGEYHPYDLHKYGYMQVLSLDTLQIIDFTLENLKKHRATLNHYANQGEYYWDLLLKYPDLHVLIDGICRPVDKKKAIEAKDWTILGYNKSLVEPQEIDLISKLNEQIRKMMFANDSPEGKYFRTYATKLVEDPYNKGHQKSQVPTEIIKDIGFQSMSEISDIRQILRALPEIETAKDILVSSILSPYNMINENLTYTVE